MSLLRRGRKESREVAGRLIPVLPRFIGLLFRLMADRRVRLLDKGLVLGVLAYVLMPVDLIPDILGVLGWADDLFLLGLSFRHLVLSAGASVVESNWKGTDEGLDRLERGLEELGTLLPGPIHRALERFVDRW